MAIPVEAGALPTFVGSSILFIASGTLVFGCSNELFSVGEDKLLKYKTTSARWLRRFIRFFSTYLVIAYFLLFLSFFINSTIKYYPSLAATMKIDALSWFFEICAVDEYIYLFEILIFPLSVIFAAILLRWYISIRYSKN